MGFTLNRIYDSATATLREQHLDQVRLLARSIDDELLSLARIAENTANFFAIQPITEATGLYQLLGRNANSSPLLYGAAMAFEPYAFRDDRRLFAPYVYGTDRKRIDIASEAYDYRDGSWEWYTAVQESGLGRWSEPYFDNGAGNIAMVTYSAPLLRDGHFIGVTTVDLRLDRLADRITEQLEEARFMVMSDSGRFVAHNHRHLILNGRLQDLAEQQQDPAYRALQARILGGESGFGTIQDLVFDGTTIPGTSWLLYTPIRATGWYLATLLPERELTLPLREQIRSALLGLTLTIVLIFVLVWLISARLTRPIAKLEMAVSDVARGKLDTHIENIRSLDELGRLSIGFNRMLKNLKKQIDIQSQQEAAQKLIDREWQMARETQRSLLPTEFPPFPDRREFELHAVNQAAHHVAGDFFDFFLINSKTLVFVIADVSGKGMPAALVMAVTRTIVRDLAQSGRSPADILRETNERLRESQKGVAFVTLFLGSYNIGTGRILYANGGHVPPFLLARNGKVTEVGAATGTIVGMLEQQEYRDAELRLQPGETLLLYTDGFPEARSPSGEFFGAERMRSFLEAHVNDSASLLCESALNEINNFQNRQLADDITLLALKRNVGGLGNFFLRSG